MILFRPLCWLLGRCYSPMDWECGMCGADHTIYDGGIITRILRRKK